ncbi:hypothetical protein PAXINDRAFT_19359 [Paxillus involutus ATCC 200175]|uniref:Uncharacterized protein n=1 Tax=Paxillus involutus ATCC 200175 TaxID=664439 RepID=A0A0C9SN79_PAXIN|nr:hypothetical protein PAXINDRAFT_19359 [Paxillus involutus ATCC 200175]
MRQRGSSVGSSQVISTQLQSRIASRKPSWVLQARQTELAGTTYTWSNSNEMGLGSKTNLGIHDNPLADSKAAAVLEPTNAVVSPTETIHVAETIDPRSPRDEFPAAEPQAVPLPAMYEVMATRAIRQPSSNYFNQSGSESGRYYPPPADETRPLISRPSTPPIITNYPPHTAASQIARSYRSENPPANQPVPQPLVARGWVEFSLPHGLRYYENRESHAITDIDLRNLARLDEVSVTIETAEVVPEGCEMWIRGTHGGKKGWRKQKAASEPVIFWVDHRSRRVLNEVPSEEYVPSGDDDIRSDLTIRRSNFSHNT